MQEQKESRPFFSCKIVTDRDHGELLSNYCRPKIIVKNGAFQRNTAFPLLSCVHFHSDVLHDFNVHCKVFEIVFTEEIVGSVLLYLHQRPMLARHALRSGSLCRWKSTQAVTLRWADGTAAGAFLPKYLRENTLDPWC